MSALPQSAPPAQCPDTQASEAFSDDATHLAWRLGDGAEGAEGFGNAAGAGTRTLHLVLPGFALIAEAAEILLASIGRLPGLHSVTLSGQTTGEVPKDIEPLVAFYRSCRSAGLDCQVEFRLDDACDPLGMLGRRSNSLGPILEATSNLRLRGVAVRWLVPLVPALTYRLEAIFSLARDETVDALLLGPDPSATLTPDENLFAWDFVSYRFLEQEVRELSPARQCHYRGLRDRLAAASDGGAPPKADVDLDATAFSCRFSLPEMALDDDQSQGSAAAEIGGVLLEGKKALLQWLMARAGDPLRGRPKGESLPTVMVIGAYGGEHIGDIAILGGVLFRIHRKLGTTRAILMSQRPNHTRHLVPMLDVPVDLTVEEYDQARIREILPQVDGVVFAGGPLMDLPKQLVKHLYGVSLARQSGKPFFVEGIGSGPFKRWPSEWTARRLIKMAEGVTLRTSDDGKHRLVRGLEAQVGRDPAFDYLETRGADLTRLTERDRAWIDRLLEGTEGRTTVGINIRPIHSLFTIGAAAAQRAAYTGFIESRFEERLAEGLRRFKPEQGGKPCFIFFPMNAIQFGSPDLRSAYRIARILRRDVDFRIWEDDASLDGVVALLRRLDLTIAMRFHAAIFALSQGRRTIGIDYRVGGRDKVAALLGDFGQSENCCRIDTMTSDWLASRLTALAAGQGDA